MPLAGEGITITLDGERIELRPTLRAAMRLERRHGGFTALLRKLEDGSLVALEDVITECGDCNARLPAILSPGLAWTFAAIIPPLQHLVLALMGFDEDAEDHSDEDQAGARITFAEHQARLYRLGTGWLGWTPAETWAASPAEITQAYLGRIELLEAVGFLSRTEKAAEKAASLDDKFAALITKNATLPNAVAG